MTIRCFTGHRRAVHGLLNAHVVFFLFTDRIIPKFMVQGGDPTGTGQGGEAAARATFKCCPYDCASEL